MKLNPKKCKEIYINFITNSVTSLRPICVGYKEVERIRTYKLLGVIISDHLKWNAHVEFVIAKAAKRLFALRLLSYLGRFLSMLRSYGRISLHTCQTLLNLYKEEL